MIEKKGRQKTEARFVFVKKGVNQKYVYNPHPEQFHFKLYSVLTTEKIKLEQYRPSPLPDLHYEYMVIEALKRFTNSEDFMILRDRFRPKDRLRHLLTQLMDL